MAKSKLDNTQEALVEWLCTPLSARIPKTRGELCTQLGVSPATLRRYERHPAIRSQVDRRLQELNVNPERVAQVVDSLFESSQDMSLRPSDRAKFAQLYLNYVSQVSAHTSGAITAGNLEELSDEELEAVVLKIVPGG